MFYHATLAINLPSIRESGLLVAKANPASKIKGVWVCTAQHRAWAVLHVLQKFHVSLEEIVVIEVNPVVGRTLTRFKSGLYWSLVDIPAAHLGIVINGLAFSVGVQN